MGAVTEVYCDPSIGGSSGSGTIGDPYSGVQYALDTMSRDATNGNRLNVKSGTDETLSSELTLSGYGSPSITAPLIIQGYTSTAGDGGKGGISGGGTTAVKSTAVPYLSFIDMHLHNTGSATILKMSGRATVSRCEFDNTTGDAIDTIGASSLPIALILDCHFHNIGTYGIDARNDTYVAGCHFANGTNDFTAGFRGANSSHCVRCTFDIDGASHGIDIAGGGTNVIHNSILSSSGTGNGINLSSNGMYGSSILNNLIEGFSGTGGAGIAFGSNTRELSACGHNAIYDCTTEYESQGDVTFLVGDDETLLSSPFAKSGSNTFANRGTYYEPNDVGNVRAGAFPTALGLDKGAIQSSGGGGSTVIVVED